MTDSAITKRANARFGIPLLVLITSPPARPPAVATGAAQQQPIRTNAKASRPPPAPVFFALDTSTSIWAMRDRGVVYRRDPASERRSDTRAIVNICRKCAAVCCCCFPARMPPSSSTEAGKQKLIAAIKEDAGRACSLPDNQNRSSLTCFLYSFILR